MHNIKAQRSLAGGFSESESFVGKISYLDFWNRQLSPLEIGEYYRTCEVYQGNLYSWTDFKFKTIGDIKVHKSEFCKACNQNLTIDNGNVVYGDQTAFVKCADGFKIQGSPVLFCLRTSKWDVSKMPSCKIVKCNPLKTPSNGRLSLTKTSYNGQAKFVCDDGFNLIGSETITCTTNGNWSDNIPHCKSIHHCPALEVPENGVLIYASDSGVIDDNMTSYPLGTFVEIKCNSGFTIEGENLISCTENGIWDFDVEDCEPEPTTTTEKAPEKLKVTMDFWRDFKEFLFSSCNSKGSDDAPKLCRNYVPDFDTDLSSFELPETPEYEGMDRKLSDLLKSILESSDMNSINAGNFLKTLLRNSTVEATMRDSYRFVISLYIDLIMMDEEMHMSNSADDNINENIKRMLHKIATPIYRDNLRKT